MAPANEKKQAHDLIERLAPSQISAVVHLPEPHLFGAALAVQTGS